MKFKRLLILAFLFSGCFKHLPSYDEFIKPSISHYPCQNMLVYEIEGDPDKTAEFAISKLYKSFYKIKHKYSLKTNPPRARWITPYEMPKEKWIGKYALELNKNIDSLPVFFKDEFPFLTLEEWCGEVFAEILHTGKYNQINNTVKSLEKFISQSGYIINGYHEEIYIKGPGFFFKGNPQKYITLIRYPVKKLN